MTPGFYCRIMPGPHLYTRQHTCLIFALLARDCNTRPPPPTLILAWRHQGKPHDSLHTCGIRARAARGDTIQSSQRQKTYFIASLHLLHNIEKNIIPTSHSHPLGRSTQIAGPQAPNHEAEKAPGDGLLRVVLAPINDPLPAQCQHVHSVHRPLAVEAPKIETVVAASAERPATNGSCVEAALSPGHSSAFK